ncbi:hypothetical protein JCM30760_26690 [Thiomicrorhabdus hydrogeniphila]
MSIVTLEMQLVRQALGVTTKEERKGILGGNEKAKELFLTFWHKREFVCARCRYFRSLGGKNSGTNGTCSEVAKNDYTRPEEDACNRFEERTKEV